jgi:hypothetical protein
MPEHDFSSLQYDVFLYLLNYPPIQYIGNTFNQYLSKWGK